MDLSALIFVALAVAWAAYLIPKAIWHHEDSAASRTVDSFSDRMRVLARREPVDPTTSKLVVSPGAPAPAARAVVGPDPSNPQVWSPERRSAGRTAARREAAGRAARRRRRVLGVVALAVTTVGGLVVGGLLHPAWTALPGGLLVAWLVACRLMVRRERASTATPERAPTTTRPAPDEGRAVTDDPVTDELAAVGAGTPVSEDDAAPGRNDDAGSGDQSPAPAGWDPVPMTLPTYVDKPAAPRRSVRTIDLDSTGVWTSGRTEADAALAREADEAERSAKDQAARDDLRDERRASGS